jgi:hypothetical protein
MSYEITSKETKTAHGHCLSRRLFHFKKPKKLPLLITFFITCISVYLLNKLRQPYTVKDIIVSKRLNLV